MRSLNDSKLKLFTNQMTISLNVLKAIYNANLLSQMRETSVRLKQPNVLKRLSNQVSSQQVSVIYMYSASVEEQEIVCCFLHFHKITVEQKKNTITSKRLSCITAASPVRITKGYQFRNRIGTHEQTLSNSPFQVSDHLVCSNKMIYSWLGNELRKNLN